MSSLKYIEEIKRITREFFQKTAFEVEIEFLPPTKTLIRDNLQKETINLPINIKTEEPQILIGEGGQTLFEIQHLLSAILKKTIRENDFYIDLDINNYKKKKIAYLKELAHSVSDEVALTKKEKRLPKMLAYERRIIHLELTNRPDVITKSVGQEPERRIVISPRL